MKLETLPSVGNALSKFPLFEKSPGIPIEFELTEILFGTAQALWADLENS